MREEIKTEEAGTDNNQEEKKTEKVDSYLFHGWG